ncbi:alpha/beta hydrolase [Mesorhizobium tianshanense]|uniref:Pimeloyl-ACP methyl ester carboxylesterase n=1 Tax=Mesorhizobium tianshanense TaxID=39844 RepID=A0A562N739_9HYPH|nr:alpha/beta hydrolase [Mesorhizobium tianshanense]TWI27910.1 pimeloyl-ACP methyl ester carboxylesterase [Mesorhizobium tianshanense]GLS39977.1 alpha/beta hydrolase [Mesorhizobium tianshanense]
MQELEPASNGYAEAAEGLRLYYEIYGEGEPIVVLAGGLMPIRTTAQITGPLAERRQVIAIDLEGHGRTGLRDTPMSHERNGDDVAAVLRHLGISQADVAGYSHGADAAIWMAIQHPAMVRNLIVIATGFARDGWYPEAQEGMSAVNSSLAEQMKATPIFEGYGHPDQFPLFVDRMGELMRQDWNWREEVRALPMPVLLIFADHDSVSMQHIAEFFALFGGGIREPGWIDPQFSRARLAIIPGYSHYNLGQGPEVAQVIESFLTRPTSPATQFAP